MRSRSCFFKNSFTSLLKMRLSFSSNTPPLLVSSPLFSPECSDPMKTFLLVLWWKRYAFIAHVFPIFLLYFCTAEGFGYLNVFCSRSRNHIGDRLNMYFSPFYMKLSLSATFWKFLVFWISVEFFLLGSIQLHLLSITMRHERKENWMSFFHPV